MDYCHKMNISNRDIKLENTLLHSQGADRRPMVKLCDFGETSLQTLKGLLLHRSFPLEIVYKSWSWSAGYSINEDHSLAKTAVGTPGYTGKLAPTCLPYPGALLDPKQAIFPANICIPFAAPEVLTNRFRYDAKQADVWSSGVMLYAMVLFPSFVTSPLSLYVHADACLHCSCSAGTPLTPGMARQPTTSPLSREYLQVTTMIQPCPCLSELCSVSEQGIAIDPACMPPKQVPCLLQWTTIFLKTGLFQRKSRTCWGGCWLQILLSEQQCKKSSSTHGSAKTSLQTWMSPPSMQATCACPTAQSMQTQFAGMQPLLLGCSPAHPYPK